MSALQTGASAAFLT